MAYVAIQTKFLGPTNYRGDRIKATAMDTSPLGKRHSVTVPYRYGYSSYNERQHREVAELLLPEVVNSPENVRLVAGGCDGGYIFIPEQIQ